MLSVRFVRHMLFLFLLHCTFPIYVEAFDLTIIHNNDVHAHFEQINGYSGECTDEDASKDACYGGEARRVTIINETRSNIPNTLVLDAGDRFTGTKHFLSLVEFMFIYVLFLMI